MQVRPSQQAHGAPALTLSNCGWQANAAAVEPPTWKALGRVAAVSALPFIGFGFCDNSIMVRSSRRCVALFSSAQSSCPPRFFRATSSRRRWEARSVCLPWPLPAAATWFQTYSASASQARSRCVEQHACCCRVALRSRGNASPPLRSARAMRWAFAHGSLRPRCSCPSRRVRLRRSAPTSAPTLMRNSRARGDDRQPVPGRGFRLHPGDVPSFARHARRGVGCRGGGGAACSNTLSADDCTSDPRTL